MLTTRREGGVKDLGCDGTAGHQLDLQQRLADQQIEAADDRAAGSLGRCREDSRPWIIDDVDDQRGAAATACAMPSAAPDDGRNDKSASGNLARPRADFQPYAQLVAQRPERLGPGRRTRHNGHQLRAELGRGDERCPRRCPVQDGHPPQRRAATCPTAQIKPPTSVL